MDTGEMLFHLFLSSDKSGYSPFQQAALVLNASRRFRYTLDLKKEEEKEMIRRKIRAHAQVIRVMCHFFQQIYPIGWLYLFVDSKIGFFRQHFFSKKLGKKISEVQSQSYCYLFSLCLY
jgi:hypothetical protein